MARAKVTKPVYTISIRRNLGSPEKNLAIGKWLGRRGLGIKNWSGDDGQAAKLLPELMKRGYIPTLQWDANVNRWKMHIAPKPFSGKERVIVIGVGSTMADAIVSTILQVPEVNQVADVVAHEFRQIARNIAYEGVEIPKQLALLARIKLPGR